MVLMPEELDADSFNHNYGNYGQPFDITVSIDLSKNLCKCRKRARPTYTLASHLY